MRTLLHVSLFIVDRDRVLLIQESDPEDEMRWNLPGGHVEPGESITDGAVREAQEETGLLVSLRSLVGVYAGAGTMEKRAIRFVFHVDCVHSNAAPGDGVLAVQWISRQELDLFPDERLLSGTSLRGILEDGFAGTAYPLAALHD